LIVPLPVAVVVPIAVTAPVVGAKGATAFTGATGKAAIMSITTMRMAMSLAVNWFSFCGFMSFFLADQVIPLTHLR
jgi:hypothetical protein